MVEQEFGKGVSGGWAVGCFLRVGVLLGGLIRYRLEFLCVSFSSGLHEHIWAPSVRDSK